MSNEYLAELVRFGKVEIDMRLGEFAPDSTTVRVQVSPRDCSVPPYGMLRTLHNKQIETAHFDLVALAIDELVERLAVREEGAPSE